jgi:hypothetical protein
MVETEMAIVRRRDFSVGIGDGVGVGAGDWEVEGWELKAMEPIRIPVIPVRARFCMVKGGDSNWLRMPFSSIEVADYMI